MLPVCGMTLMSGQVFRAFAASTSSPYAFDSLTNCRPTADFAKIFAAGMTGCVVDLAVVPRTEITALSELGNWADASHTPDATFQIIRRVSDFQLARDARRFAVVLNSQDAAILEWPGDSEESRFNNLRAFHDLGLRILQLTYNDRSKVGGGYWEDTQVPLSLYGRRLVAEMNRLGILVDLSHCDEETTLDGIKTATRPVVVTHAGCRALFDNARNKSDKVIRALADSGGYFGVYNMTLWMTDQTTSSVKTVCDHIDHATKVGGIDLVGFGSDHPPLGEPETDHGETWLESMTEWQKINHALGRQVGNRPIAPMFAIDLNGPDRLVRIADELHRRSYRQDDIDKILGLNFIRVFKESCG